MKLYAYCALLGLASAESMTVSVSQMEADQLQNQDKWEEKAGLGSKNWLVE